MRVKFYSNFSDNFRVVLWFSAVVHPGLFIIFITQETLRADAQFHWGDILNAIQSNPVWWLKGLVLLLVWIVTISAVFAWIISLFRSRRFGRTKA